jgi:hypothetical protein
VRTAEDRTAVAEVRAGDSYQTQAGGTRWFGLGSETAAHVSVRWPDGETTEHPIDPVETGSHTVVLTHR